MKPAYKRVLIKLSGEALAGPVGHGLDENVISGVVEQIKAIHDMGVEVALVIGGEDSGVRRLTREKCDFTLSLPLKGKVNSLNASVALGIAAYEVVRRKL